MESAGHNEGTRLAVGLVAIALFVIPSLTTAQTIRSSDARAIAAKERARQVAAQIDQALAASWKAAGVEPADAADDAEFMRRLYLDLTGKIPSVAQARAFLADEQPDKRARLVDELLESAIYAAHFANIWRDTLLAGTNPELRVLMPELESWLRLRFAANTPYDQLAAELVATSYAGGSRRSSRAAAATIPTPVAFFQANERKPESLTASLSSVFLGVQVECAQCHDHPFARWKQDDFWSLAAFFRGLDGPPAGMTTMALQDSFDRGGLPIPGGEATAAPRFLDGSMPVWRSDVGNRATLAAWMTSPENPFFARAAVNLVWAQFFGRSLSAEADASESSPAYAKLLDALAEDFIASGFDLKQLVRAVVLSRPYQLTSQTSSPEAAQASHFACMPVRRMTADQLFDSLVQATGFYEAPPPRSQQPFAPDSARADFRNKFAAEGRRQGENATSIVQALVLMNGKLVSDATSLERSKTLNGVIKTPLIDIKERLETLFLAALSRPYNKDEATEFLAYVKAGDERERLADVFWVLLNSAEFASNH